MIYTIHRYKANDLYAYLLYITYYDIFYFIFIHATSPSGWLTVLRSMAWRERPAVMAAVAVPWVLLDKRLQDYFPTWELVVWCTVNDFALYIYIYLYILYYIICNESYCIVDTLKPIDRHSFLCDHTPQPVHGLNLYYDAGKSVASPLL